eukprot:scaffold33622_cov211-Skeletonema_dohrnii-CCMP3373.AAC.2
MDPPAVDNHLLSSSSSSTSRLWRSSNYRCSQNGQNKASNIAYGLFYLRWPHSSASSFTSSIS